MKRIGVLTSGGDAPGMNAAIRAIVRTAIYHDLEVFGIMNGYKGLIEDLVIPLHTGSVSNIIQRGGTILKTARSEEFKTVEGRKKSYENLRRHNLDGLVVIGGNGTFTGARIFISEYSFPVIGLPGTIDNDLFGTDTTIGYDTAVNTVMEAVDRIRDTADSHERLFFVEVMGRDAGFIALDSGIACGAEDILVPETTTTTEELIRVLEKGFRNDKKSGIIIVAEGDEAGGAFKVAEQVKEKFVRYDTRVTILGHIQRGGSPTANDRILASRLGYEAVKALIEGLTGVMVGLINQEIVLTPFIKSIKEHKDFRNDLIEMARILSS